MNKLKYILFFLPILIAISFSQSPDTLSTSSGLKYIIVEKGSGAPAENGKAVEVHYTGKLIDGKVFDSSRERNEPIEFILGQGQVIKGWDEGIALMSVGDKFQLIIPPDLGYGSKGAGNVIPANATLIFDVELMSVHVPLKSIADTMMYTIVFSSLDEALKLYDELKKTQPDEYNFHESQLNSLGYELLQGDRVKDAIVIFKLNIKEYPDSYNVYDSMGEAYSIAGENDLAIKNYKKSLEINPKNKNAEDMIKKIEEKK